MPESHDLTAAPALLDARGVSKRYGPTLAVDDVDLCVAPGEVVGLLGKNGAGKSTLIKVLAGVQRADAGTSTMGGTELDLRTVTVRRARAAGIAVMFQELELFPQGIGQPERRHRQTAPTDPTRARPRPAHARRGASGPGRPGL